MRQDDDQLGRWELWELATVVALAALVLFAGSCIERIGG